jgi:hypothetical protein
LTPTGARRTALVTEFCFRIVFSRRLIALDGRSRDSMSQRRQMIDILTKPQNRVRKRTTAQPA